MNNPAVLSELITRLEAAGIDWDAENIADLLWLSRYMTGEVIQRPKPPPRPPEPTPLRRQTVNPPIDPPPPDPSFGLYSDPSQRQRQTQQKVPEKGGIPFQTPTAPALRKTLAIGRSLRPLMRKVDSYTQRVLDEDATAEQTAEQGFCMTVVRPAKERWLEVALVVEDSASSFLWKETIRDFKQVLERQGAFRAVTVWHLQTTSKGSKLFARSPQKNSPQPSRSPKELIDASGRRLILLVSDCISLAWQNGALQEGCLALWAKHNPLAIVQLLPGHLWSRTALSAALEVQLGAWVPGAVNRQLLFHETPIGAESSATEGLKLPVITLEPNSLAQWARMIAGWGESWTPGVWFDPGWQTLDLRPSTASTDSLTPDQLVKRFMATASGVSKRLAGLMALVPVSLPIIYLLQETMLPESTPLHLAEIFMSGLIERERDTESGQPVYNFVAEVREPLMASVPTPVKADVLDRVSQYIGKKLKRSIYSFTALLQLEQELGETGGADLLKFASIAKQVLQQMGGSYASLVEAVETQPLPGPEGPQLEFELPPLRTFSFMQGVVVAEETSDVEVSWPPMQVDEVTVATITFEEADEAEERDDLYTFKVAKLGLSARLERVPGFWQRLLDRRSEDNTEWIIEESQGQARRFIETLERSSALPLSAEDSSILFRRLSTLPFEQFEQLLVRLNPLEGAVPSARVSPNNRVSALVDWAESADGPGMTAVSRLVREVAGDAKRNRSEPPEFSLEVVFVPGDTFLMGSPDNEPERIGDEGPQHSVRVPSFSMGRYPVTQAQWRFVAELDAVNRELDPDPSSFKGDNRPVEQVNWYEAVEFCERLSIHTGRAYRLPTEAEWEYACRAGTDTPFHFGATITTELAHYNGNYAYNGGPKGEYREETTPVDRFGVANAFGLCGMHGNVYEWCKDHWHDSYRDAPTDGRAWITVDEAAKRVVRGGSWNDFPWNCRSAYRLSFNPDVRYTDIGFRVVCRAPE
ncbi:MAG: formylglycine-generating enzyme family protein [Cyanobacteria bacterium P01_C01_bin.121]